MSERISYEEIDRLVFEYQGGDNAAGEKLLDLFGGNPSRSGMTHFLGKYQKLLAHGVINFSDKDTRRFIRCFIKDKSMANAMVPFYQYKEAKRTARKTVQRINDHLAYCTEEEIGQELSAIFLEKALRYKKVKENVNFCGYLYNTFRFDVSDHLKKEMKDMLSSSSLAPLEEVADQYGEIHFDAVVSKDLYFENETEEIGLNWAMGQTANHPFDKLNVFERMLLLLTEVNGLSLEETGKRMGYHRDTIWRRRKAIKAKLQKALMEEE